MYDVKISGSTRSSIYIYDVGRLRVKHAKKESDIEYSNVEKVCCNPPPPQISATTNSRAILEKSHSDAQ
jgi:hypothetical protein